MGLKVSKQQPEERNFLIHLMDWLESQKKIHHDNDAITNGKNLRIQFIYYIAIYCLTLLETVGSAHLENYALKLFLYADNLDRAGNFGKNVVKAFYTSGEYSF